MSADYCARYGFNRDSRERRLALLELGEGDRALAERLQREVIEPQVDSIVERFYAHQRRFPEIMAIIGGEAAVTHLKQTQRNYLLSLGRDFGTKAYFNERLRVGWVHARQQVPLSLYQSMYRLLQQLIIDAIPAALRDQPGAFEALSGFVLKVTTLDMSLAIETYHTIQVDELRQSVENLHSEGLRLRERVERDNLTGLATRDYVTEDLEQALAANWERRSSLCLMMADLDHFKSINDTYGHLVGDKVLRCVARALTRCLREFDTVGRFGGEEFIIVLEDTPLELARKIAERLRVSIAEEEITCEGERIDLTISIGLSAAEQGDDTHSLIERADMALYDAKEGGRNRVTVI